MPNEMIPGMNTQAKKPAFAPKGDISPIPMQPAPVPQEPKSIREYLNALKAGQVPTFTNIPGQEGQFGAGNAMVFKDIAPGAGGQIIPYGEGEQRPGAIPEGPAADPMDSPVVGTNPYDMAKERLQHIMPDLKEQFDAQFANTLSLEEYNQKWPEFVNHTNNELIKHYDKRVESSIKLLKDWAGEDVTNYVRTGDIGALQTRANSPEASQKRIDKFMVEYDKLVESTGGVEYSPIAQIPQEEWVRQKIEAGERLLNELSQKGAKDQGAAGPANLPPELQTQFEDATALYRELQGAKNTSTGQAMPHEKIMQIISKEYPELQPYL